MLFERYFCSACTTVLGKVKSLRVGRIFLPLTRAVTESEAHSKSNDVGLQKRVEGNRGIAMFRRGEIVGNFQPNAFKEKFLVVFRKHSAEKPSFLIRPAQDIHFFKKTPKPQSHTFLYSASH